MNFCLMHMMAEESENAEKDHYKIILYPCEIQSQNPNHTDKLFTNTRFFSLPHKCPKLPTKLAEIFQSSAFFFCSIRLSLTLHLLRAIFFSSAHSEQDQQCKGYLLLNSYSADRAIKWHMTKSSSSFILITPARKSAGDDWGKSRVG